MKQLKAGRLAVTFSNNQQPTEKEKVMKKIMTATLMVVIVLVAFFGMATQATAATEVRFYQIKSGETLFGRFGPHRGAEVCRLNKIKDCNRIQAGQQLRVPSNVGGKSIVYKDMVSQKRPSTTAELSCIKLGAAPFNPKHSVARTLAGIDLMTTLSAEQKAVAKRKVVFGEKATRSELVGRQVFREMLYQSKHGKKAVVHIYNKAICDPNQGGIPEVMDTYSLGGGVFFSDPRRCGNPSTFFIQPVPVVIPPVVELPPVPPVVEPPPSVEPEPQVVIPPFHMTPAKAGKPRCELQAGTGVYGNRVYEGGWAYGENICYVWKDGEWQAGPGLYAMYGAGHSLASDYRGKEAGVGLQAGIQRNWINDRNNRVSADLKLRWTTDRSWGSNDQSGYAFTQKGQKFGLYGGYAERINKQGDLLGMTAEYWKSFGQTVNSTWAGQPVQDRGSVGVAAFYETKLSKDDKWRQRIIGGVAHTNWDEQNWLKGTYEIRYDEWLMFGPQISLPISVSQPNQPLSSRDLTTVGAFVRVELGNKVREADAKSRETQLKFIPPASSDAGRSAPEATTPPE